MSEERDPVSLDGDGRPSALLSSLRALGLRGHEQDARALLGGAPHDGPRLLAALDGIESLEARSRPTAWSHALKGRLLLLLRQMTRAREALDLAVGLDPSLLEARVWRAQAKVSLRDGAGALADLDALAAVRRPSGWEEYLRGLALMTMGRPAEAAVRLRAAERRGVGALAAGMWALALAEQRRFPEALKLLANAGRTSEADGVPLGAFEGMILRQKGDLEGSLRALIRASRGPRPYPWVFSHRADVHNRMGFYRQALSDLKRFHELLPREPSAFAQAANVLYDQAYYDEALRAMAAAVRLAPKDPDLRARRGHILVSAGRLPEAVRVIRGGLRLAPDDVHLREELVEAAVMAGDAALAEAELRRGGLGETPFGRAMRGVLRARAGRRGEAAALFSSAAAGLRDGDPLRERTLFYAACMRALGPRGARPAPGLRLCGVGVRHPFQLSVETLRALAGSEVIFTNLPDIEARRFLALFPGRVLSVPRRPDATNRDRARWVVRRLKPSSRAAFLTRIHPFIYRRMGWDLLELCRAKGISVRAYGAVSLTELAGCRAADEGGDSPAEAARVFDISHLNRNPDLLRPSEPTIVYCIGPDGERPRLVRLLRRAYPASGGAFLLGGSGEREDRAPWIPWRRLGISLRLADIGCVLYIPPAPPRLARKAPGAPVVRLYGLGSRAPEETTLETLAALSSARAAFAAPGPEWGWLSARCPGLRRASSPAAIAAAAKRFGEARVAIRGSFQFESAFASRLLAACRARGVEVRATPSVSPVAGAFARSQVCLGGDYGYQGIQSYSARRLLAEPRLFTPRLPLVVYGAGDAGWAKLGALLSERLPPGHLAHAYPERGAATRVPPARLGAVMRSGGTALVPPTLPPTYPDLSP